MHDKISSHPEIIKIIEVCGEFLAIDMNNPCDIAVALTEKEAVNTLKEKQKKYYY
ncbi:hypothetical protein [Desulfoscipio geothermicus]|uniref:Uncharacterized protein n=1 Tax=Desulfoscipio geothermicus DSM 3669 TaxID=1121426 RepID=A0A1I6DWE4_9FIRM|nr:hypothetical protein [Desulfoscipio geothermicus]SFR09819.1 hypothetical protein SAMN05660706_11968 [Desulfoscipio geothermicus DSM 3669]